MTLGVAHFILLLLIKKSFFIKKRSWQPSEAAELGVLDLPLPKTQSQEDIDIK